MEEVRAITLGEAFAGLGSGLIWVLREIGMAFYNVAYAITHPVSWLDWIFWENTAEDKLSLMKFVFYGGSTEFFFVCFTTFLVLTAIGIWRNSFLWAGVRVLEGLGNTVGRVAAWAGLLMVLQQVIIVFLQRIFTRPDISIGFGIPLQFDVSWWAEELKLYNAIVVTLCLAYTFVQGGHVRVDLVYSAVKFRTKRTIDMLGSLFFMMPVAVLLWLYSWYFMWRHLIVPNPAAAWDIERYERSARALRWNVETIGFSPNGFTGYFLFKVLIVLMCGMIFLQGVAFFWRSYLEWREGEESDGKYLDKDVLDMGDEPANHAEL